MKKIHWRPILNFLLYWVSTDGRVRTFRKRPGILKPGKDDGYARVSLSDGLRTHPKKVHRLVTQAFLRPVIGKTEVNHKDADKANNNLSNLEWSTRLENMQHCDSLGLRSFASGEDHGMSKLNHDTVLKMRAMYSSGNYSYPKLSRIFGISLSSAQRTVKAQTWKQITS